MHGRWKIYKSNYYCNFLKYTLIICKWIWWIFGNIWVTEVEKDRGICIMGIDCQLEWMWADACIELVYWYSVAYTSINCTVRMGLLLRDIHQVRAWFPWQCLIYYKLLITAQKYKNFHSLARHIPLKRCWFLWLAYLVFSVSPIAAGCYLRYGLSPFYLDWLSST
jgi:hypothetical protein